jgi:predicted dehydrogenase
MVGIAIIGYGYWGPNLARNFSAIEGSSVAAVCDADPRRLQEAGRYHPGAQLVSDYREAVALPTVDAVMIATPVRAHYEIAAAALTAGKHVILEKPMTATLDQGRRLIDLAARRQRLLLVDHTFLFTGAVRKIKEIVDSGDLGEIHYYDSVRANLGRFHEDVNVFWDVAVHDVSILLHLIGRLPDQVSALGARHVSGAPENIGYLTMMFDTGTIGHVSANWLSPRKIRQTLIAGSRKMIVYDDIEPSEKIKIYDKGVTTQPDPAQLNRMRIGYRLGDMWAPDLDSTEALTRLAGHVIDCIEGRAQPLCDGEMGLRVLSVLAAADRSLAQDGRLVPVVEPGS